MPSPEKARTEQDVDKSRDAEQPLSDTLLGDAGAGGLAGQGGIVDIEDDLERDDDAED